SVQTQPGADTSSFNIRRARACGGSCAPVGLVGGIGVVHLDAAEDGQAERVAAVVLETGTGLRTPATRRRLGFLTGQEGRRSGKGQQAARDRFAHVWVVDLPNFGELLRTYGPQQARSVGSLQRQG